MGESTGFPQNTLDEAVAARLAKVRESYLAALHRASSGAAPPEIDSFLTDLPETERSLARHTLEQAQRTFVAKIPATPAASQETSLLVSDTSNQDSDGSAATVDLGVPPNHSLGSAEALPGSRTVELESQSDLGFEVAPDALPETRERSGRAGAERKVAGYEIISELGRGGMGVVYRARHIKLDRQVALKMVLVGGHASPEQLQRFTSEAQAVAHLQHPNIVQIYEIGDQDGLPYFSLEFVDGGSLAERCAGKPLPELEAARMVEKLARAMHHAHQHNVVHRDLKPANVLLRSDGTPKITDFGLAKRLESESSSQTRSGAIMGTPSYMAPEQALGEVHRIGPLTDVYALGAILYELLTGRPPFLAATPMDTVIQVTRDEPVPPTQLQPKVPRDLETICLKCLQKESAKRYESAATLADDLRRFQAGEPILARPVSAPERLWRWCRRNPKLAGLTAAVLILLVAAAVGSSAAAWMIAQERDQKELQRQAAEDAKIAAQLAEQQAKQNFDDAQQQAQLAVGAIYDVVTKIDASVRKQPGEGMQQLRLDVLADTRERMDRILEGARGSALFNRTAAALEQHAGDVYLELGHSEKAMEHYLKCLDIIQTMAEQEPDKDVNIFNLAVIFEKLGNVSLELEDLAIARDYHRKALDNRFRLSEVPITDPQLTPDKLKAALARAYSTQSTLASMLGDPQLAWQMLSQQLQLQDGSQYANPREFMNAVESGDQAKQYTVGVLLTVGELGFRLNDVETCRTLYERALKRSQAAFEKNPGNVAAQRALAGSSGSMGDLHLKLDQPQLALPLYQQSHEIVVEQAKQDPDNAANRRRLSFSHYRIATAQLFTGNHTESKQHYEECLAIRQTLAEADARNAHKQIDLMIALARCDRHTDAAAVAANLGERSAQDPSVWFQVACGYALCLHAVAHGKNQQEVSAEEQELRGRYAEQGIKAIRQAITYGYKDKVMLKHDPDLRPLRDLPEFESLLSLVSE